MPDYIVWTENGIWSRGFDAVKMAGYWDATWEVDQANAFVHSSVKRS